MAEFDGKAVIVTGGAKGIGGGITRAFAAAGARVACVDVDAAAGVARRAAAMTVRRRATSSRYGKKRGARQTASAIESPTFCSSSST